MSLIRIVEDYKSDSAVQLDAQTFKAAMDTYKGSVDILYEIYLAQASCNRLVDILFDVSHRLEDMEEKLDMEGCCNCDEELSD